MEMTLSKKSKAALNTRYLQPADLLRRMGWSERQLEIARSVFRFPEPHLREHDLERSDGRPVTRFDRLFLVDDVDRWCGTVQRLAPTFPTGARSTERITVPVGTSYIEIGAALALLNWDTAQLAAAQLLGFPALVTRSPGPFAVPAYERCVLAHELSTWIDQLQRIAPQFGRAKS